MFQTVPDTSSYVKVRHDSIFKQVMSKITIFPSLQSFVLLENLDLAGEKNLSLPLWERVGVSSITVISLEICGVESKVVSSGINAVSKWPCLL